MERFDLLDITKLKEVLNSSTVANDRLMGFLNRFSFDSRFCTDDDTIVYDAGGENEIQIEFLDIENPTTRKCSVSYMEFGEYNVIEF